MSADIRRAKLVDAAVAVMIRDGVASATTRAIVAEADMPVGMFHYCFRSKDELVLEVMRTLSAKAFTVVGEILRRADDPVGILRAGVDAYWAHVRTHREERLVLFELTQFSLRNRGYEDAATEQYRTYVDGMSAFLTEVADRGAFTWHTEPTLLGRWVVAVLQGVTMQWLASGDEDVARRMLDHLVGELLREAGLDEGSSRAVRPS